MNDDLRFTRLASANVLVQAHAAPDSRFMILPLIQNNARIVGWTIYDCQQGELLAPNDGPDMADGYIDGVWPQLFLAREYLLNNHYREEADNTA